MSRLICLVLHAFGRAPRANGGRSMLPAVRWSDGRDVHVSRPFDRLFFAKAGVAHEVEHILTGEGNEMHDGHTWHFCCRSWHALRIFPWRCARKATPGIVETLRANGNVVANDPMDERCVVCATPEGAPCSGPSRGAA